MPGDRGQGAHGILQYPISAKIKPELFLGFMEAVGFFDDCVAIGINDDDILGVQFGLMLNPKHGKLIKDAGGLRRLTCRHVELDRIFRIYYAYFEFCSTVVFYGLEHHLTVENFSASDRDVFRRLLAWERRKLAERAYRAKPAREPQ